MNAWLSFHFCRPCRDLFGFCPCYPTDKSVGYFLSACRAAVMGSVWKKARSFWTTEVCAQGVARGPSTFLENEMAGIGDGYVAPMEVENSMVCGLQRCRATALAGQG